MFPATAIHAEDALEGHAEDEAEVEGIVTASEDKDELVVADCDLDVIEEVRRVWQFFRDRRPDTYQEMSHLLP